MSVDDFHRLGDPPPNGAEYIYYDPPVVLFMNSFYESDGGQELEKFISKLLYGHHEYGETEDWAEVMRLDYNSHSNEGHDEIHLDVIREGEKVNTIEESGLREVSETPVPENPYYYPHFAASYTRDKWSRYVTDYEEYMGLRRFRE